MWREGSKRNSSNRDNRSRDQSRGHLNKRKPDRGGSKSAKPKKSESQAPKITENELSKGVEITDVKDLLKACERHPQIKVTDTQVHFNKNVLLKDVSVKVKGPQEDTIYAGSKGIYLNVRRGNSYVVFRDTHAVVCGRRGLRKFYDLYPEYLEYNLGNLANLDSKVGVKEPAENKSIHRKIFGTLKEDLDEGKETVVVIESNKANGENCQISWVAEVGAWSIASKHVSMLLRSLDDVSLYISDRFHFAELIAREWFTIIKQMKPERVEAVKECLRDFTLVGEYVGNPNYQHLVKYEKQGFMFYSLVHKYTEDEAMNPKEAFDKIKSLGLQCVTHKEHPACKTWQDLNALLKGLYKEIKESGIEKREEGVVVYIVSQKEGKETLHSICKLKTLEYMVYRKLREKLRALTDKKQTREAIEAKYQEEVRALVGMNTTPHELSFYFEVAKRAFEFSETQEDTYLIFGHFVTFLSIMVYCTVNSAPMSLGYFEKGVVQELLGTPWSKYVGLKSKLKINDSYTIRVPRTIVFVPLTIPGMGKSYLYREVIKSYCEDNGLNIRLVSSDQLRKSEMDKLKLKEPNLSENALFARTRETADEAFSKLLLHYVKEKTVEDKVIFIDKNHPPNAIRKTIDLINQHRPRHADVRFLALMPKCKQGPSIQFGEKEVSFPFSLDLCLSCLVTVQTRREHETLNGNGVDSANVVIMFYNMFRDFKFDGPLLKELGFNGGISVDFFGETFSFSKEVTDKLTEILGKLNKPGDKPKDIHLMDQLLGLMQENFFTNSVNRPSKDVQFKCIANVLKNLPVERPSPPLSILTKVHPAQGGQSGTPSSKTVQNAGVSQKHWEEATKDNAKFAKAYETQPPVSAIAKKDYKPKKTPIYLGIFVKNDEKSRVQSLLRYSLSKIQASNSDSTINEDLVEFSQENITSWKWPEGGFHITTCLVGGDKADQTSEPFKSFEEGVHFPFKLKHIVYVPGMLCVGVTYLDNTLIKVQNRFPHMTLATKGLNAKDGNQVLETMFGGVFYSRYKEGLRFGADKVSTLNIMAGGQSCIAYLFELPQEIYFDGETKAAIA